MVLLAFGYPATGISLIYVTLVLCMHFTFYFLKINVIMKNIMKLVVLLLITSLIRYCAKTPELKSCWHTMLEGVKPCMDSTITNHIEDIKNGTSQLLDFICYKDGDRIACQCLNIINLTFFLFDVQFQY